MKTSQTRFVALLIVFCAAAVLAQQTQLLTATVLTIDEAMREAMDRNLDLVAEKFNLSVADARIITAKLRPNPVLSVGGDHLDVVGTGYNAVNQAGPTEYSVRTDFLLERGQKRANRVAVAEGSRAVVELQFLNSVRTLIFDVQNAYVEALQTKDNLALAQENLKAFGDIVEVNRKRVSAGDLAEVELFRTELAQLQFEGAVRQANLKLRSARVKLQLLLGRTNSGTLVDVTGELRKDSQAVLQSDLLKAALVARPDLRSIQRDQARSLADLKLQLAQSKIEIGRAHV